MIILVLILALVVRLYKITSPLLDWHAFRQVDTASVTRFLISGKGSLLRPVYQDVSSAQSGIYNPMGWRFVEFPLFNFLHAQAYKLFPQISLDEWGRLVAVLAAVISVYLTYLIGREIYSKSTALIAAFIFATLPYNVYFTRVVMPDPLSIMLFLASLYGFIKYTQNKNFGNLLVSAFLFSLSILVKPFTIFFGFSYLYFLRRNKIKLFDKNNLIFAAIVFLPFIAWRMWIQNFPAGIPRFKWMFNFEQIRFKPAFWRWIFGERLGKLILGIWGLVPFSLGLLQTKNKPLLPHLMFLGLFFYISIFAAANVRHDYYQLAFMVPVSFLVAVGIEKLWNYTGSSKIISRSFLFFCLGMMYLVTATQVREYYKINHPEIIEVGKQVQSLTKPDDLIIAPYNGDTTLLYYTNRSGWPVVDDSFDNLISKGAKYYVSLSLNDADTSYITSKYQTIAKGDNFIIVDLSR